MAEFELTEDAIRARQEGPFSPLPHVNEIPEGPITPFRRKQLGEAVLALSIWSQQNPPQGSLAKRQLIYASVVRDAIDTLDARDCEIEALKAQVEVLNDERTDWILVADGIKHDYRCFHGEADTPLCLRCDRDRLAAENATLQHYVAQADTLYAELQDEARAERTRMSAEVERLKGAAAPSSQVVE